MTVAGLGGEPDYEQRFAMLATDTDKILHSRGGDGPRDRHPERSRMRPRRNSPPRLNRIASQAKPQDVFMLMMIGHGTFDGTEYKFNFPGPDISGDGTGRPAESDSRDPPVCGRYDKRQRRRGGRAEERRPHGHYRDESGMEKNATVFARFWVEALRDPAADADKNEIVSALEAFHYAQTKTAAFYTDQKRLATGASATRRSAACRGFPAGAIRVGGRDDDRSRQTRSGREERRYREQNRRAEISERSDGARRLQEADSSLLLELAKTQEAIDK